MKRQVAVEFGDRDVILELARHRLVQRMQGAQCDITIRETVDDNTEAVNIKHLRKRQVLVAHLALISYLLLFTTVDLGLDAGRCKRAFYRVENLADYLAPVAARGRDRFRQSLVAHRVQMGKR